MHIDVDYLFIGLNLHTLKLRKQNVNALSYLKSLVYINLLSTPFYQLTHLTLPSTSKCTSVLPSIYQNPHPETETDQENTLRQRNTKKEEDTYICTP